MTAETCRKTVGAAERRLVEFERSGGKKGGNGNRYQWWTSCSNGCLYRYERPPVGAHRIDWSDKQTVSEGVDV